MTTADLNALAEIYLRDQIVTAAAQVESLSRDFYWCSPVLKRDLELKSADVVVQARSVDDVKRLIRFAHGRRIPVTLRGAGTGDHGQCAPAHGGIVLDLAALDRVVEITPDGVAHCEPAARMGAIEQIARRVGWELRCYPGTVQKTSVAGFCAGGSGGIGSITWGGLRENGTVHALTILTMEAEPRELRLSGSDIFKVLHAWGTNGVIIGVELKLAPRNDWAQLAVAHDTFAQSFDFIEAIAMNDSFKKRLVTNFEWPLPSYFTPLQKWVPAGRALAFFEVADDQLERLTNAAVSTGGSPVFVAPHTESRRGAQLNDYTWNHTPLWACKADPALTYLQCGFSPVRARDQFRQLKARYGDDFMFHIEMTKWEGVVTPGSIPVVRHTTDERLQDMINFCGEIGVSVTNPRANYMEGSGRWRPDDAKLIAKPQFNPRGLAQPG